MEYSMFYMYARTDLLEPQVNEGIRIDPFQKRPNPSYVLRSQVKELVWHQFSIWHLKDLRFSMSLQ